VGRRGHYSDARLTTASDLEVDPDSAGAVCIDRRFLSYLFCFPTLFALLLSPFAHNLPPLFRLSLQRPLWRSTLIVSTHGGTARRRSVFQFTPFINNILDFSSLTGSWRAGGSQFPAPYFIVDF